MDGINQRHWRILAPLFIIIAGVFWGMIGLFSRSLSGAGLNALQITVVRCLLSTVVMLLFLALTDGKRLKVNLRDLWLFVGTGVFSIVFFNVCYFTCISKSTLSIASILLYTSPCFVMLLSCLFFRESFTIRKGTALIFAFVGCMFTTGIIGGHSETNVTGAVLIIGLGSGFGYALYSIIGKIALKKYSAPTVITYTLLLASTALMPFSNPSEIFYIAFTEITVILNAVLLCVLSTLLPFLFYTKGLEHVEASKAALLVIIEPVVATIIGVIVFHEEFTVYIALGIVLVFFSIVVINTTFASRETP
jgi:drug/metabolite transporter (DMT)-like permease